MKKFLIIGWVAFQVIIVVYLWVCLGISIFTSNHITEIIDYNWWLFFFVLELWTTKWIKEAREDLKSRNETKENS